MTNTSQPDSLKLRHDTQTRRLEVAFLGGSYDSAVGRAHRTAIEMDRRFKLTSGCFSRNKDNNLATAIKYGISMERSYESLITLLMSEKDSIDAVVILTPQDQHREHILACLKAGVPVICEKALVPTADEAEALARFLSAHGGYLAVTYNYTGYPMLRELKHIIEHGRLGNIQQIHIEMPQEGFAKLNTEGLPIIPQEWRLSDYDIPTISLDLGIHLHMMVRFLTGKKPLETVSTSSSYGNFKQVVDNVSCLVRYTDDMSCSIWYSKTAFGNRNGQRIRVFGEKGAAEWVQEFPEQLRMADNIGSRLLIDRASGNISIANQQRYERFKAGHPAGFIEAYANYYFDVADSLSQYLQNKAMPMNQYVFGIDESIEGLRLLEAIARSSNSNKWEKVGS